MTWWMVAILVVCVAPFAILAYGGYVISTSTMGDDGVKRDR